MDSHANGTSTLVESERALRPVTLAFAILCPVLGTLALAYALKVDAGNATSPLWVSSACAFALFTFSNLQFFVSHPHTLTIGTIPIAVESAALAAVPVALRSEGAAPVLVAARIFSAIGAAVAILFGIWFLKLSRASSRPDALDADCILIVLGAAVCNGRPTETLRRRLDLAASLLAGHPERQAILTGGAVHSTDAENDGLTEADIMRTYLLERGVPSEQIVLERRATNTWQNIENSLELARGLGHSEGAPGGMSAGASEETNNRTSVGVGAGTPTATARKPRQLCVISNDYHLYRAIRCGRALGARLVGCGARTPLRSWPQQWCREVLTILAGR